MNFLVWNIRGIGNDASQKHLYNFCQLHKIKVLAILEPKVQLDSRFFCRKLGFSRVFANQSNKVWCFINNDFDVEVLLDHEQLLHLKLSSYLLPSTFQFTCIYAKCDIVGRRELWDQLRNIADSADSQPWLIGGDFNTILHLQERTRNKEHRLTSLNEFGDMILDCGLIDVGYEGSPYTWTNHRVWKRLDRMLYSENWLDLFQFTKVTHLPRIWSNHSPLLISVSLQSSKPPSSFRFFKMCTRHHLFLEAISKSWQTPTSSEGMINLQHKLYRLKQFLKWWNRNNFGDIFENIKKAEWDIKISEHNFEEDPTEANLVELKRCTVVLTYALTIEEDYWRQKAACRWIDEGERNTKKITPSSRKKGVSPKSSPLMKQAATSQIRRK
ncbi:hypothetical protein Pfo_029398 [Paulownia fortunei]|nr:hypothetical protein Pfo_029398 [Paulownia fortunei]